MRILYICNEYPPEPHGGVGSFVKSISKELSNLGHKVYVLGAYKNLKQIKIQKEGKVIVTKIPLLDKRNRVNFFLNRLKLAKYVRGMVLQHNIDIIETPEDDGWSMFFNVKIPWITRLHNPSPIYSQNSSKNRGTLTRLAELISISRTDNIIAVSEFIRDASLNIYRKSSISSKTIPVIYNGIDTNLFNFSPYEDREVGRIVFAGTIKPMKNIEKLLKAYSLVSKEEVDVSLHLFGKDTIFSGESYYELMTKNLCNVLKKNITYHGRVPHENLPPEFAKASICVFPSHIESFGLVAAEAMACGRPVIYSENGPGHELINDGLDGLLCNVENEYDISEKILFLLKYPTKAKTLAVNARNKIVEKFALPKIINENLSYYESCINQYKIKM